MLPYQFRLPATVSFKNATNYSTNYFLVKIVANDLPHCRFGFIISKAVAKNATERNRARRLLRSCIEERLDELIGGYDMLFLLKKGIIGAERENLLSETDACLRTKNLLNP